MGNITFPTPIALSPVFRIKEATKNGSTLWVNQSDRTATKPRFSTLDDSTMVNVTCPAEGIPSQSAQIFEQVEDVWPPMAASLTFPAPAYLPTDIGDFGLYGGSGGFLQINGD